MPDERKLKSATASCRQAPRVDPSADARMPRDTIAMAGAGVRQGSRQRKARACLQIPLERLKEGLCVFQMHPFPDKHVEQIRVDVPVVSHPPHDRQRL
jgi:hypothetical protein